jgi:hypothetical protein
VVVLAEKLGIPGVVVTAPGFAEQARSTGYFNGVPDLQVAVYPGAFDTHSEAQLIDNTTKIVFPNIIDSLTKPIVPGKKRDLEPKPAATVFSGDIDEINRYFADKGWSDGMAITPPTVEKIEEFLKYTDLPPDQEIAVLPAAYLRATPWNIAVNGVMAGCRPEYLPILIAYVRAIGESAGARMFFGSTHSWIPYLWVNGPLGRQLEIDHGQGLIGYQTNAAIGRTLGLIVTNLAGFRIKQSRMGTFGYTVSWALAEDEEYCLRIGWEPYHMQKGFDLNASTVTATTSTMWGQNNIPAVSDITPEIVMQLIAREMTYKSVFASGASGSNNRTVLITPPVAKVLAAGRYTKHSLEEDLVKTAGLTTFEYTFSQVYGSFGAKRLPFHEQLAENLTGLGSQKGKLPPWYPRFPGWEEIATTHYVEANKTAILVCGDESRNKTQTLPGGSVVTQKIELPEKWNELMHKAGYRPLEEFYL